MGRTRYNFPYCSKRQEAVAGRADCGPEIRVGFGVSVFKHVSAANRERSLV